MTEFSDNQIFRALTAPLENGHETLASMECQLAFTPEPRPLPSGLMPQGLPLGHIAFMGDFETE